MRRCQNLKRASSVDSFRDDAKRVYVLIPCLLTFVLAGCYVAGESEPVAQQPLSEPVESVVLRDLSFVWHNETSEPADSFAVSVVRAAMESLLLVGEGNLIPEGYPGYAKFVANNGIDAGVDENVYIGTAEFVIIDVRKRVAQGTEYYSVDACESRHALAYKGPDGVFRTGNYLWNGTFEFSAPTTIVERFSQNGPLGDVSKERSVTLNYNVFSGVHNYNSDELGGRKMFGTTSDDEKCRASLIFKQGLETSDPPVLPFSPGWPIVEP